MTYDTYYEDQTARLEKYGPLADAAKARFEAEPDARFALHLHHEELGEALAFEGGVEGAKRRIEYVLKDKNEDELETRLRLVRPIPNSELPPRDAEAIKKTRDEAKARYDAVEPAFDTARAELADARYALSNAYYPFGDTYSTPTVEGLELLKATGDAVLAAWQAYEPIQQSFRDAATKLKEANDALLDDTPTRADLLAIHARICEPDCPWSEEQGTIFPRS